MIDKLYKPSPHEKGISKKVDAGTYDLIVVTYYFIALR